MEAPFSLAPVPTANKPKRIFDVRDMIKELPVLMSLKNQKWMARLPRNMFLEPKNLSGSDSSNTMLASADILPALQTARSTSLLVPQPNEEIVEALDARYFIETFDPIAHMLESLPESKDELSAFMRTEISAVDVAKDVILTKLHDEVRANYNALIQGMKVVQDVDLDLVRAQIHVKNGRRHLATVKHDLVLSSLKIVKTKQNLNRVCEIVNLGSQILSFFSQEKEMNLALQEHQFITAVDICIYLRQGLAREEMQKLTILEDIRLRMQNFIPKLRDQFDQSLRKIAGRFDPLEYKELLKAYITLADHSESLGFDFSSYTLTDVLSKIPEKIIRSIDDMTRECMRQVFIDVSPKKLRLGNQNIRSDNFCNRKGGVESDPMLTPSSQTIKNVKRCYENLTDLMHTYYLLRAKINSRDSRWSLYNQVLCDTGMTLLRYRKIVWENIQLSVLEIIEKLDMTYGYKMEQIITLSLATTKFVEIGEEFSGAPSSKIRKTLRIKCIQYLDAFHNDNIELTRMLLDTESWLRVTASNTDVDDNADFLNLIEKRSGHSFKRKLRENLTANSIYSRRVFPSFFSEGNPFNDANSIKWLSMKQGIRLKELGHINITKKVPLCAHDNQNLPVLEPHESEFVLISSSLAGFVRLCGVYLKMMEYIPHIAWDTFCSLNNLFEFNLYAVLTNFVSTDSITQFLRSRSGCVVNRDTAEWNVLRNGVCRIADDISSGNVLLQSSVEENLIQLQDSPTSKYLNLRKVIRAPATVEDAVEDNLYAVAERSIACEAIISQCRLLDAIEDLARSYLPDRHLCLMDEIYERNRVMARELCSLMYSTIATQLVNVPALKQSISAVSWNTSYISDQPNEYIVNLVQKCGETWGGLQILMDGSIPMDAREDVWAKMVQIILDSLLQAFSTISKPTPQGRALMLLDLHALQNGLDLINHIGPRVVPRGREYVCNYIKAFYYDEKKLLEWAQNNKSLYSKVQYANLLKHGVGSTLILDKLRELVISIDAIIS
ncbi:uncharacterized protein CCR75_006061 [Bremia lactucae]|uniref:Uncharacterized protein n=1 Tax=Bremia lactucae TaxID=4779 RepID=A0A976FEK3_BRELC|nr:hypothetical protein CCR75_006061 [Bremia lactucae]